VLGKLCRITTNLAGRAEDQDSTPLLDICCSQKKQGG
jgi:hypothetical protein